MDQERLFIIAHKVAAQTQCQRDLTWWQGCKPPPIEDMPKYWKENIDARIYNEIMSSKQQSIIKWNKPDIEAEIENFQQAATELGLDLEDMFKKTAKGKVHKLPTEIWPIIRNTDSWEIKSMPEVEIFAAKHSKDLESILDAISNGQNLPAPIVMFGSEMPYLISGNLHLMVAKVMGVTPEVFSFDLSNSDSQNEIQSMPVTGYRR